MISVYDVANWFLSKQSMEHKKLQKLCYYAQAWHYALLDKPLFSETIEAWVHGPVIPALYQTYKNYGWQKIPMVAVDDVPLANSTSEILNAVYDTYGELSGGQLEMLSHSEAPWKNARGNLQPYEICTNPIKPEDMKAFYLKSYQEAQND